MGKVSNGERRCVSKKNQVRNNDPLDRILRQQKAWREGRNVVLVVDNPNPLETAKRKIRVKAREYWGDPRKNNAFNVIR